MTTETPTDELTEVVITVTMLSSDPHEHCELIVPDEEGHPSGRQCMQPAIKRVGIDLQDGERPTVWTVCEWHISDAIGLAS